MATAQVSYGDIVYRLADRSSDGLLRSLLRDNDMESWVSLSFQREPDYFLGEGLMGDTYSVLVHHQYHPDKAMGMYSCSYLPVKLDGQGEMLGYLGSLRVGEAYRNKLRYLKQGYDSIRKLVPDQGSRKSWFTSIAAGNHQARRLLEAGLKGLPKYTPLGKLLTMAISTSRGRNTGILQPLAKQDIEAFVSFYNKATAEYQYSPWLSKEWLQRLQGNKGLRLDDFFVVRDQGRIVAGLAIWDQRAFKQTVIHDYAKPLKRWRLAYNLYAKLSGRPQLPASGDQLQQVYISFVACEPAYRKHLIPMIQHALHKITKREGHVGVLGLSTKNPLLNILKKHFPMQTYETCIERVDWEPSGDALRNSYPVQPEVAVL